MTLEQISRHILIAAEAQDLAGLGEASKERESTMAMLGSMPPTIALRDAVAASIAAGQEATHAIRAIRQRIRKDSRRLANIEHGFLRALAPAATHQVDYKG